MALTKQFGQSQSSSGGIGGGGGSSLGSLGLSGVQSSNPQASSDKVEGVGKMTIDLSDPLGSIGSSVGSLIDFAGQTPVGQAAQAVGGVIDTGLKAVGGVELPYLGNDPTKDPATLGQVPGLIGDVVSAPGRFVEREVAEQRALGGPLGDILAGLPNALPGIGIAENLKRLAGAPDSRAIPADLQARLDEGESVETIADELVQRGQGFSSDVGANLAAQIVFDPLNLLSGGTVAAGKAALRAGRALSIGDDLTLPERAVGTIFNAASRGMNQAGAATIERVIGPVTSGVFHAIGTRPYQRIMSATRGLAPEYAQEFERAFALGAGQMPRAVITNQLAQEVTTEVARHGEDVVKGLAGRSVEGEVQARLLAKRSYGAEQMTRATEELLGRTAPTFDGWDAARKAQEGAKMLATVTGMSIEDAARVVGRNPSRQYLQTLHLARYGKAGDELAQAKALVGKADNIDVERLTVLAPDTLTDELAEAIEAGDIMVAEAVENFSVLRNHFLGKQYGDADVLEYIGKIRGSLPTAVREATTGKNPLPKALGDWRAKYAGTGYDIGFAPKDGWGLRVDEDGTVLHVDPFIHFTSDVDPVTMRNPLGRFLDGMTRGVSQTVIVQESRQRLVDDVVGKGLPVSPDQARAIHKAIIEEAASRGETPRGLSLIEETTTFKNAAGEVRVREPIYNVIFRRFLTDDEYQQVVSKVEPWLLVMRAFEGNLDSVGLTQKLTGKFKSIPLASGWAAKVAEGIYPKVRFKLRPTFQVQELIESPFLNALRGVNSRVLDPDVEKAYQQLGELPIFRYLTEAYGFLGVAGTRQGAQFLGEASPVGRALGRFGNIQGRKEVLRMQQVIAEHGEEFEEAVNAINPRFWRAMEEAYGTSDPRLIADRFLAERMRLGANEDIADAMAAIDEVKPMLDGPAGETVWQAFRDSFEKASLDGFKTHFFNPQRGWLERSLNHPYLGLYPLSYMWGKILPEFARFLLKRPFGLDAPLVGAVATQRVQQAFLAATQDDEEFQKFLSENEDAIYFANLLIPGTPWNLPVNAPAWARHISEDAQSGRKVDANTVTREIADSTAYAFGPAFDLNQFSKVGADIFDTLQKAAAEYDGQFPTN